MADHKINISEDGTVDNPAKRVKKDEDSVRWVNLGDEDWLVYFPSDSPLKEGARIHVPASGKSKKCKIKDEANPGDSHEYQVLPKIKQPQEKPILSGPVIIIEADL